MVPWWRRATWVCVCAVVWCHSGHAKVVYSSSFKTAFPRYSLDDPKATHKDAGIHLDGEGKIEAAVLSFEAALKHHRTSENLNNLGVAYMRADRLDRADEMFASCAEEYPENTHCKDNIDVLQSKMSPTVRTNARTTKVNVNTGAKKFHNGELWQLAESDVLHNGRKDPKRGLDTPMTAAQMRAAPPKRVNLTSGGLPGLFDFLAEPSFQEVYWEKYPVLLHTSELTEHLPSIDQVLADKQGYVRGGGNHRRNVNYLQGTFEKRLTGDGDTEAEAPIQYERSLRAALKSGYSLQILGIHKWSPSISAFLQDLWDATLRPGNVNGYITPPGLSTSLIPHTDFQCSLMVQLHGSKRWRLWIKPDIWLPVRYRHIRGRDQWDQVKMEWLGKPYMDVTLKPGDILYVPRGCIHYTSTDVNEVIEGEPDRLASFHLTVGMEAMLDHDVSTTWEAFFGAGSFYRHEHVQESLFTALGQISDTDIRFRETVPRKLLSGEEKPKDGWGEHAREMLHALVDQMVDHTPMLSRIQDVMTSAISNHNKRIEEIAGGKGGLMRRAGKKSVRRRAKKASETKKPATRGEQGSRGGSGGGAKKGVTGSGYRIEL